MNSEEVKQKAERTESQKDRKTERQKDRKTERQKDKNSNILKQIRKIQKYSNISKFE